MKAAGRIADEADLVYRPIPSPMPHDAIDFGTALERVHMLAIIRPAGPTTISSPAGGISSDTARLLKLSRSQAFGIASLWRLIPQLRQLPTRPRRKLVCRDSGSNARLTEPSG